MIRVKNWPTCNIDTKVCGFMTISISNMIIVSFIIQILIFYAQTDIRRIAQLCNMEISFGKTNSGNVMSRPDSRHLLNLLCSRGCIVNVLAIKLSTFRLKQIQFHVE